MTDKLRDALTQAIQAAADQAELDATVSALPEAYAQALAEVIDGKRAELVPAASTTSEEAPSPLADVTAAELAELLLARPELRDALSALLTPPTPEAPAPAAAAPVTLPDSIFATTSSGAATITLGSSSASTISAGTWLAGDSALVPTTQLVPEPEALTEESVEDAMAQLVEEAKDRVSEDFHAKLVEALTPVPAPELDPALLQTLRDTAERLGVESSEMSASQLIAEIDRRVTSLPGNAGHNRVTREHRIADAAFSRLVGRIA